MAQEAAPAGEPAGARPSAAEELAAGRLSVVGPGSMAAWAAAAAGAVAAVTAAAAVAWTATRARCSARRCSRSARRGRSLRCKTGVGGHACPSSPALRSRTARTARTAGAPRTCRSAPITAACPRPSSARRSPARASRTISASSRSAPAPRPWVAWPRCRARVRVAERSRQDLTAERNQQANLALAGFIGAGVGAAATVATFLLWKPAPKNQASVRVTPVAAPRTLGLGVVGRF